MSRKRSRAAASAFDDLSAVAEEAAELLGAMANPKRMLVLCKLLDGERSVGDLAVIVGLSQAALSKVAGVSQQTIADAETGTYPRWDIVCALCDALGITLDVLAGQPSGERPEPIDRWANRRKREVEEG